MQSTSSGRARDGLRIVVRDIGGIQVVVGASMLAPMPVALAYGELYTAAALALAAAITSAIGALMWRACRDAGEPREHHAMLIASAGWLVTAALGALPLLLTAYLTPAAVAAGFVPEGETYASSLVYLRDPLHALFESMSAYTTTGLTMSVHEPSIGHGLLTYRSCAQWFGGAGVIVLALAILRRPSGVGQIALYGSEATGIKLRPSVLGTARAIWKIYLGLTAAVAAYLAIATFLLRPDHGIAATLFDAVNHAMAAQSTGGFSTLDDSIAGYGSYALELAHIPPMLLGAISIPLYYQLLKTRNPRLLWADAQFRTMTYLLLGGTAVLVGLLAGGAGDPVREGVFQFASALTTTGWQTSNIGDWSSAAVLWIVSGAMLIGGAAGATVGGIKLIRAYLIGRGVRWRIRRAFLPANAVDAVALGDRSLSTAEMTTELADAASFCVLYLVIAAASLVIVSVSLGPEFTLADAAFEVVSAQSTVGLSSNVTTPDMPRAVEAVFIVQMWIGRLEIFPVLALGRALLFGIRR